MVANRMRKAFFVICLALFCAGGAQAQLFLKQKKTEEKFPEPKSEKLTEKQWQDQLWATMTNTMPSDKLIRENVVRSETTPFWSRRSVWSDQTMAQRSAEFGGGKLSDEAGEPPTLGDRWAASQLPEAQYSSKSEDDAILAAVYRHFFDYHAKGFAKDATVYFLGLGPHKSDAPPSLIAALQSDPVLKRDGMKLRPASRSLEVTDDAIRDRDTGAYGPVFRVDEISPAKDGATKVVATFSERDGFWFTRDLTLQQGKAGWDVIRDDSHASD
jgi:hypothetical protein